MIWTLSQFAAACGGQLIGEDRAFTEVVIDTRKLAAGELFAALPGERLDGHQFVTDAAARGAAGAIVLRPLSPEQLPIPMAQIKVASVAGALAAAARVARTQFAGPVIGVAGSNGKTTVKEMTAAILSQRGPCLATRGNLNNHLGVPMTLLRLSPTHRSAVIEMGANRAGDVEQLLQMALPDIGLVTNAGAEHLEGFGSLEAVARAEGEMLAGLPPGGTAIINADDPYAALWRSSTSASVVRFGLLNEAEFHARSLHFTLDQHGFSTRFTLCAPSGSADVTLGLAGRHNVLNALAAAAAATSAGATLTEVVAGLGGMRAVKGRLQLRRSRSGAWLIDDSYNANPSSVSAGLAALRELPGRRWMVLGDMAELGAFAADSHREIGTLARSLGVERLYTFGSLAGLAADSFGAGAERFDDANALARVLAAALDPDVLLLIKGSRVNRLERLVDALAVPS